MYFAGKWPEIMKFHVTLRLSDEKFIFSYLNITRSYLVANSIPVSMKSDHAVVALTWHHETQGHLVQGVKDSQRINALLLTIDSEVKKVFDERWNSNW